MVGALAIDDRAAAASLIRWWRDAGVDTLVEDEARAWLAAKNHLPAMEKDRYQAAASPVEPLPIRERIQEALPPTLPGLLDWMRESADVPEAKWGRTRVLPAGEPKSELMILIDAPDAGELIAGETGTLFDKMLAAIGRDRSSIWLAPFATIRPVGRVSPDALRRLTAIARHHIGLVAPKRLLIMGDTPSRALLGTEVIAVRGQVQTIELDAGTVDAVATHHPRFLHDRQNAKSQAWNDLQLVMKGL
jgi:DNA polymerase